MPSSAVQTSALRSEEHTSELQSHDNLGCRLLLEKMKACSPRKIMSPLKTSATWTSSLCWPSRRLTRRPRTAAGSFSFFFNDTAPTEIYTLSLHDALPI